MGLGVAVGLGVGIGTAVHVGALVGVGNRSLISSSPATRSLSED